jgi:hypothetical protein
VRAGLLVPMASAAQAAALGASLGLDAVAVPCPRGVLLLPRSGAVEDQQVQRASRLLRSTDVLVLRLADERVGVQRWRSGRLVDEPAYGLVGGVDGDAERALLGRLDPLEAEGAVDTADVDPQAVRRMALAAAVGPVRPWQVVLTVVLLLAAALLSVDAVVDLLDGRRGLWAWARAVVWPLAALYWAASLRGLLARRRAEKAPPAAAG